MLSVIKKRGETPLQVLDRLRAKNKKLVSEKLSYIGRLDPMAEGEMLVLVGSTENKERAKYLNFDKEYVATFLLGISTDSGDILGIINRTQDGTSLNKKELAVKTKELLKLNTQKYPWMSGKTIGGKKMFDIFKSGEIDRVERPSQKIKIYKISSVKINTILKKKLENDILKTIDLVDGNFRQKEIASEWKKYFARDKAAKFQTISLSIKVSSGTYIRGLCENLEKKLGVPVLLYKLKRTKIFIK